MRHRQWAFIAFAALVGVALVVVGVTAQGNVPVLVNADFEGGFTIREASEVEVAVGWDYAYLIGDDRECRAPCYRPEAKPERIIVSQGAASQRWFSTYARHFWALHQGDIRVPPGAWVEFSCDVQARTSTPPGDLGIFVGVQPWNGNVFDRAMIWGKEQVGASGWIYNQWVRVSVTAQAYGDKVRVAVGSNPRWAVRENTVYVDNCALRVVDGPVGPTATPMPTYTALPTYTPYPTPGPVTPCPTCEPNGGGECDYDRIRSDVATVVAEREPVKWPR